MKFILWTLVWWGLSLLERWLIFVYRDKDMIENLSGEAALVVVSIWLIVGIWLELKNK